MASNFFRIDGWPVAPAVAIAFLRWKADHDKNCPCGVPLRINSAYRTRSEQHKKFVAAYRRGARSTTVPADYRWYQGDRWGRVGGAGVVQSPDVVSNHTRGYALDVNISQGGVCQAWNLKNAPKHGFNWTEGRSAREPWHWCWKVAIYPYVGAPDPWRGRGAPDPVPATDPGMTRAELLGGPASTEGDDDVVTAADIEKIAEATAKKTWMYKSAHNGLMFGDMLRNLFNARRWGSKGKWHHGDATAYEVQNLAALRGEVAGLTEAVKQLAGGKIDAAAITAAVTKAVEAGMADVEITLKTSEG